LKFLAVGLYSINSISVFWINYFGRNSSILEKNNGFLHTHYYFYDIIVSLYSIQIQIKMGAEKNLKKNICIFSFCIKIFNKEVEKSTFFVRISIQSLDDIDIIEFST